MEEVRCEAVFPGDSTPVLMLRAGIFPVMSEEKCKAILKEYQAKGEYQEQVYQRMRSSYRDHYRRMVPLLVNMLDIRSNNTAHRPVVEALTLVKRYAGTSGIYYPTEETVPLVGVVRPMWRDLVQEKDKDSETRVNRVNYELCVLDALQEKLRCRELWVVGANKYRNPDDDLPKDFEDKRTDYYKALRQPEKAEDFVNTLRQQMIEALTSFDQALPKLSSQVRILDKQGGWISLTPLTAQPEPQNLRRLKAEITKRWGVTGFAPRVNQYAHFRLSSLKSTIVEGTAISLDDDSSKKHSEIERSLAIYFAMFFGTIAVLTFGCLVQFPGETIGIVKAYIADRNAVFSPDGSFACCSWL